jgi:MFS family permease
MEKHDPQNNLHWYQGVPRYAWTVLFICALGWMFDCMDQHFFNLVRSNSIRQLVGNTIAPGQLDASVKQMGAYITAVFLIGWAVGGFIFGVVGDRIGRTKTLMITVLLYAVFTGMNALVQTPLQYAICRFLTALGVGGEFAAGASLVAEIWPERSRAMALGSLQALSAVGNVSAAFIAMAMSSLSWRWVYVVGAVPALLVFWIQMKLREPDKWLEARERLKDKSRGELGNILNLFTEPELRRNTIAGVLLAIAGVGGFWGVGVWLPDLVGSAFKPFVQHSPSVMLLSGDAKRHAVNTILQMYKGKTFLIQMIGGGLGMFSYAVVSQKMGRRPSLLIFFILAFLSIQGSFRFIHDPISAYLWAFPLGFFCLAPFSAYAVYFPELFPTRIRATGVGFCYNCARILAAFAAISLGDLARVFSQANDESAGLRKAAMVVAWVYVFGLLGLWLGPETRNRPLPE